MTRVEPEIVPAKAPGIPAVGRREPLLIIEDDPRMQRVLSRVFAGENYEVLVADNGPTGLQMFAERKPVAVLLDLMLPEMSGREVCKRIRAADQTTPVIVVSAVSQVLDKVLLLELGADDYVTKPFSPRELLARLQVALRHRRPAAARTSRICFGECEVDFTPMRATRAGVPCTLTAQEFKLLPFLIDHAEQVLSREELLNEVWGYNSYPTTRTVDNQILKLRQKLERDPANPHHLQTIYGAGYRFVP